MESVYYAVAVVVILLAAIGVRFFWPRPVIVREYQRGLRFRRGHLLGEVKSGRYWLRPRIDDLEVVDARRRSLIVAGQEVLTSDRVPLKVSLVADYRVASIAKALTAVDDYVGALYSRVQLALREALAQRDLDTALAERGEIGGAVTAAVAPDALEFGVVLHQVQVRDFMMAGGLRSAYAAAVQARQEGLAALERARGESAAVRSLANAADLMERHPGIMQLRLLQALETGTGNRIVIALDPERGRSTEIEVTAEGDP